MTPARAALATAGVCALIMSMAIAAEGRSAAAAAPVRMWLTTPDKTSLLAPQPESAVTAGDPALPTIVVDPTRRFQQMEGFGAALTESAAHVIATSPSRDAIMRALFDPVSGIGLSYLRQPIGASDFVVGSAYTYDDMPPGQTDLALSRFSVDRDRAEVLPLLRQARQLNPQLRVMAVPWSPPAWMKTGGSLIGGQLIDDDAVYRAYARYFVRFLQDYAAAGVPVELISVQNEPQARPYLAGVAYHCYFGDPSAQSQLHQDFPDVPIYFTECSGVQSSQPANTFRDTLRWQGRNIIIGASRNWARTAITWNLALDPSGGPHLGGCGTCTGVVAVAGAQVTHNAEYHLLGHVTKFLQPGAVRIDSTVPGSLPNVAFRNQDGTVVLVVLNDTDATMARFTVGTGGSAFSTTLPAGAVATFVQSPTTAERTGPITGTGGKCVDVAGANTANGTAVQLYTCNGTGAQRWTVGGDGTLIALGKCADVTFGATGNGAKVQLYDCNGTGAQVWQPQPDGTLRNPQSGKCLDATDRSSADGTRLQIWDCHGGANQVWHLPA